VKYAVVIERGPSSYGASVPDLPGCVAVAETREDVERLIEEAITIHIAGMREDGLEIPCPQTEVAVVDVQVDH
jgi:predicted RNase H-like HicB family nuclease